MQRWKIIIEYEGSQFNGWQSQKDGSGIQDNLEKAIKDYSKVTILLTAVTAISNVRSMLPKVSELKPKQILLPIHCF